MVAFGGILAAGVGESWAQETEGDTPLMPEVVVTDTVGDDFPDYSRTAGSVDVLSGDSLSLWQQTSPRDIPSRVPNLSTTDTGTRGFGDVFSFRGLTNTRFFGDPSVLYVVDDVPFGNAFTYADRLFAVDYVEVFRGPQGARFGRNAYGGAINVVSKRPGDEWTGRASGSAGGYDQVSIEGYTMGPLIEDVLSFRLGASYQERDGFLTNTFDDRRTDFQKHTSVASGLFWTPTDQWDISFTANWDSFEDGAPRVVSLLGDPYQVASGDPEQMMRETNMQALRVGYAADSFDFLSVTSRREWDLDPYVQDLDLTPLPLFSVQINQQQKQWNQEIRLSSREDSGSLLDWTAGGFYTTSNTDHSGARSIFGFPELTQYNLDEDGYALFAAVGLDLSDQWRFDAGLRYDYVKKQMDRSKFSLLSPPVPDFNFSDSYEHVTPTFSVEYEACDDVLLYATTSYAFKPGGFSGFTDNPLLAPYSSERSWSTEAGVKTSAFDDRLQARLAGFYYDINDYQVERSFTATDFLVVNAQEATSYGFELELAYEIMPGLSVDGNVGYTQTTLDRFTDPVTGANLDGNTAPFVPEFDFAVGVSWELECGFFSRLEYRGVGETYYDDLNTEFFKEDFYGVLNARVGYRFRDFLVAVYGSNLTNEVFFTNKTTELAAGTPGEPRQIGVMVSWEF